MRRSNWILIYVLAFLCFSEVGNSQDANVKTDPLVEAQKLFQTNKLDDAGTLLRSFTTGQVDAGNAEQHQKAWHLLGQVADRQAKPNEAREHYSRSIEIHDKYQLAANESFALSLFSRANLLRPLGQFDAAVEDCERALQVIDNAYPPEQLQKAQLAKASCYNLFGVLERSRGEFDSAQLKYEAALQIYEKLLPEIDPRVATMLTNLAGVHQWKGELGRARRQNEKALEIFSQNPTEKRSTATVLHNLGGVLDSQGEHLSAKERYLKSLEMLTSIDGDRPNPLSATVMASLGMLEHDLGNAQESLNYLTRALKAREALYGTQKPNPQIALVKQNLGRTYLLLGDREAAQKYAQAAISDQIQIYNGQTTHPDLCKSYLLLAKVYFANDDVPKAIVQAEMACKAFLLAYPKESYPNGHLDVAEALEILGRSQLRGGQSIQAIDQLLQASKMRTTLAQDFVFTAAEAESRQFLSANMPAPKALLEAMQTAGWESKEQYASLLSSRRIVQRTIADRNARIHQRLNDSPQFTRYLTVRRRLNYAGEKRGTVEGNRETALKELRALTDEKEMLERQIADELGQKEVTSRQPTAQEILASIDSNTTLIEIIELSDPSKVKTEKQYVGFVVTSTTVSRVDFGDASSIDQAAQDWLKLLGKPSDYAAERHAALALGNLAWKPIAALIPANVDRLYFCPDGILAQIPWIAMVTNDAGARVLDRYTVSLVPYSQLLTIPATNLETEQMDALLVGAVDYGKSKWTPLPGTADELAVLTSTLAKLSNTQVVTLRGSEATVDNVCQSLPKASVVHFATHGQFVEEDSERRSTTNLDRNPLLSSSLVLATSEPNTDTAALVTGEQIAGLDLRKLQLVALSACDTGRGQVLNGDGVYGLQQAFHIAGAKSVVASQWRIDDKQTVSLMNDFYEQMFRLKMKPAQALAAAQKLTRAGGLNTAIRIRGATQDDDDRKPIVSNPTEVHPFYWASFQHSGL